MLLKSPCSSADLEHLSSEQGVGSSILSRGAKCSLNSVARVSALQAGGRGFESYREYQVSRGLNRN